MSCAVCVEGAPGPCYCHPEPAECPTCGGDGYLNGNRCEDCRGDGFMDSSDADALVEYLENEAADFASLEASLADRPEF